MRWPTVGAKSQDLALNDGFVILVTWLSVNSNTFCVVIDIGTTVMKVTRGTMSMKDLFILACFILTFATRAQATPAKVIIIRHGEKPIEGNELSVQGCERAYLLPNFFKQWSQFAAIYAQQPNGKKSSLRPIQTVTPTALKYNLKINNSFRRDEYEKMTVDLLDNTNFDGKVIIVSWEHTLIPKIAEGLGVRLNASLGYWPGSVFDQAWVITFNQLNTPHLDIVAEFVLPTDIENSASGIDNWGAENSPNDNGIKIPQSIRAECADGNSILNQNLNKLVLNPIPH